MRGVECGVWDVTNAKSERRGQVYLNMAEPSIWYLSEARVQVDSRQWFVVRDRRKTKEVVGVVIAKGE